MSDPREVAKRLRADAEAARSALATALAAVGRCEAPPTELHEALDAYQRTRDAAWALLASAPGDDRRQDLDGVAGALERLAATAERGACLDAAIAVTRLSGEEPVINAARELATQLAATEPADWSEGQLNLAQAMVALLELNRAAGQLFPEEIVRLGERAQAGLPATLHKLIWLASSGKLQTGPPPTEPAASKAAVTDAEPAAPGSTAPVPLQTPDEPPAAPTTVDESAAVEDADSPLEEARRQLGPAMSTGRFALAAWLARTTGEPEVRIMALEAAALAQAATTGDGACTARCANLLLELDLRQVRDDPVAWPLVLAAAARTTALVPYSDAANVVTDLTAGWQLPASLETLLAEITAAPSEAPAAEATGPDNGTAAIIAGAVATARDLLETGPSRTIKYQLATSVWRRWLKTGGLLAELLRPVADDDRSRAAEVRGQALRLRDARKLERQIDDTAKVLRPGRKARIESDARTALLERAQETVECALEWAKAAGAGAAAHAPAGQETSRARPAGALPTAGVAGDELERMLPKDADPLAGSAARAAGRLFKELPSAVSDRTPRPEPAPEEVLDEPLLLAWEVPYPPPEGQPLDAASLVAALAAVAEGREYAEAFRARSERGDFDVADRIVPLVQRIDPALSETLAEEAENEFHQRRSELLQLAERCRVRVETARRQGVLAYPDWSELAQALQGATRDGRRDLRAVRSELESLEQAVHDATNKALHEVRSEVERAALHDEQRARLTALLDGKEVAAARAVLQAKQRGEELPLRQDPPEGPARCAEEVYPALVDALEDMPSQELDAAIIEGRRVGPLAFADLPPEARQQVRQAMDGWWTLGRLRQRDIEIGRLKPVLAGLGLEVTDFGPSGKPGRPGARVSGTAPHRAQPRRWLAVRAQAMGGALVPPFGSVAEGHYRLLLCWDNPPPRKLLEWAAEDDGEGGVLCLYFGVAPMGFRHRLADLARQPRTASRPVVLVDDAVFLYCAAQDRKAFETTMRLGLPFTAVNPYGPFDAGLVPKEMFYGRRRELDRLFQHDGPSLLHGGRQIGKSALLRAAEREWPSRSKTLVVYIDLSLYEWEPKRNPDLLWNLIDDALDDREVIKAKEGSVNGAADRVRQRIHRWSRHNRQWRFRLLLDEVDKFLNADAQRGFTDVRGLASLRDETRRKFKPVLAGLHDVVRFRDVENEPFQHFSSMQVGPLDGRDGADLVVEPLAALGYRVSDVAATRILVYTHFNPGLIQIFCHALVDRLHGRSARRQALPVDVGVEDVEATFTSVELTKQLRERFMATLNLDHRYLVIALVLAREADGLGGPGLLERDELRQRCERHWPRGFTDTTELDFRSLLDELVGLRVLRRDGSAYGLAGPDVRWMLGTDEEVEQALANTDDLKVPKRFAAATTRPPLDDATWKRSPLAGQQLSDLTAGHARCRLVLGSPATRVDLVTEALRAAAAIRRPPLEVRVCATVDRLEHLHREPWQTSQMLVVADLRGRGHEAPAALEIGRGWQSSRTDVSTVVVVDSDDLALWEREHGDAGADLEVVTLGRWDRDALDGWLDRLPTAPLRPDERRRILAATGGWPVLLEPAVHEAVRSSVEQAIQNVEARLASRDGAAELLAATGLHLESPAVNAFGILVDLDEPVAPEEFREFLEHCPDPEATMTVLRRLGVVVLDAEGHFVPEPIAAAAWRRPRGEG